MSYTFGSPEGIAALKAAVTDADPFTMSLATWSDVGRAEFWTMLDTARTGDERQAILDAIVGGGDEASADRNGRVQFVFGPEVFAAVVDALSESDSDTAEGLLGTFAQACEVDWV